MNNLRVDGSLKSSPLPDHWLENMRAMLSLEADAEAPPFPAELKAMEVEGLIIWYDWWIVTWEGHKAIFAEIDRLRKLVG